MFFNIANLDTKSMVAILGQDCSLVFALFRFGLDFVPDLPFSSTLRFTSLLVDHYANVILLEL